MAWFCLLMLCFTNGFVLLRCVRMNLVIWLFMVVCVDLFGC